MSRTINKTEMIALLCEWYYWKSYVKGSFNNYVDKKRGEGVSRKSKLGHVTKGTRHVEYQLEGGRVNLGPRSS